jgi:magnesium-transporting ATPase (P-type)
MSVVCKMEDGKTVIFSKGAPDFLLNNCSSFIDKNGEIKPLDDDFRSVLFFNLN